MHRRVNSEKRKKNQVFVHLLPKAQARERASSSMPSPCREATSLGKVNCRSAQVFLSSRESGDQATTGVSIVAARPGQLL
jgi:hypothetical protein